MITKILSRSSYMPEIFVGEFSWLYSLHIFGRCVRGFNAANLPSVCRADNVSTVIKAQPCQIGLRLERLFHWGDPFSDGERLRSDMVQFGTVTNSLC
jgi:hypothetical protein